MCMNCNLSRSQKARANERQKKVLNAIAEQNELIRSGQTGYMWALTVAKMYDCGLFSFDEAIELIGVSIFSDIFIEKIKNLFADIIDNEDDDFVYEYNTSNLKIGMVVKTYDELCSLLEVKPKKGGKSKKQHEHDFLRYFDYEKLNYGHGYLILDIYSRDEIIPKSNTRNSLYIYQLKVLILLLVSTQAENKNGNRILKTTFPQLRQHMELVSPNYDDYTINLYSKRKEQHIMLSDYEAEYQKNLFKLHAEEKFKNSIRTALNSLQDDDLIHYETYTVICYYDDEYNKKYRQATPDEEMYIHNVKQEAAQQLGYTLSLYASRFKQTEFESIIRSRFKKDNNWQYVFSGLSIISNDKALSTKIKNFTIYKDCDFSVFDVSRELRDQLRYEYNDNLVKSLHDKINKTRKHEEDKALKWCRNKSIDKYKDISNDDLLSIFIPQFKNMQHYTNTCNDYRHFLVDFLIKLNERQ